MYDGKGVRIFCFTYAISTYRELTRYLYTKWIQGHVLGFVWYVEKLCCKWSYIRSRCTERDTRVYLIGNAVECRTLLMKRGDGEHGISISLMVDVRWYIGKIMGNRAYLWNFSNIEMKKRCYEFRENILMVLIFLLNEIFQESNRKKVLNLGRFPMLK